jgi:small conductance mechanosensitive channel
MQENLHKIYDYCLQYGLDIAAALVIFILGRMAAKFASNVADVAMQRAGLNKTLASFGRHLAFYGMMAFVCIAALNKLGVQTGSFIAVVGAASLAVGLALQGSLANFASGVLIIIFQPFKVGDKIELIGGGGDGIVQEIQIFNTILAAPDKKTIIIPNSKITGNSISVVSN